MARHSKSWKPEQSREQAAARRLSPGTEARPVKLACTSGTKAKSGVGSSVQKHQTQKPHVKETLSFACRVCFCASVVLGTQLPQPGLPPKPGPCDLGQVPTCSTHILCVMQCRGALSLDSTGIDVSAPLAARG